MLVAGRDVRVLDENGDLLRHSRKIPRLPIRGKI